MKKMAGVESVEAKLNEGKAIIQLKAGNTIRFEDVVENRPRKGVYPQGS